MEGILFYIVCAIPAFRADVPAHFAVSANFHTGSPLSIAGEQVKGIREGGKVILVPIQMPGSHEFEIHLDRFFPCIRGFLRSNGMAAFRNCIIRFFLCGCLGLDFLGVGHGSSFQAARF